MKKILTVFTGLFLMLTLVFSVSAEGNAKMSLKSNKTELSRGDKFTITVSLKNDQPVSNGGVVLSYDTAAFQLLGGDCKVKNATLGEVSVSRNGGVFVMQTDEVVSGTIFTIQMQVKEDAPFGEFSISGDPSLNIGCTLSGTKVTVVCPHDYSTGTKIDEEDHEAVCSICGDKKEETSKPESSTPASSTPTSTATPEATDESVEEVAVVAEQEVKPEEVALEPAAEVAVSHQIAPQQRASHHHPHSYVGDRDDVVRAPLRAHQQE